MREEGDRWRGRGEVEGGERWRVGGGGRGELEGGERWRVGGGGRGKLEGKVGGWREGGGGRGEREENSLSILSTMMNFLLSSLFLLLI